MRTTESSARDTILRKLRKSVADTESLFGTHCDSSPKADVPNAVTIAQGSGLELARVFGENLRTVLGSYEIVKDPVDVAQRVVARIEDWRKEYGRPEPPGNEILSWAPSMLPIPDVAPQLEQFGFSLFVPEDLHDKAERDHAAKLSAGLTGVDAAFAGTGSMVVVPGLGKSRAASLLSMHHIALVPVSKVFATLESWLAELRSNGSLEGLFRDHAQIAFITGPSKSADIELNLTLGVHGPRDVHAVIFDDGR